MTQLTVTAKGQITLRKDILEHLGVRPGEKLAVDKLPDGRVQLKTQGAGRISDAFDFLKRPGQRRLSLEDIKEISARAWAGER
jgi:AbrB family looped-hinge helix DNA binding protein